MNETEINVETITMRELVITYPTSRRMLGKLGIDYCCGGDKTIIQACAEANVSLNVVVDLLSAIDQLDGQLEPDWQKEPIKVLADYIVVKHHTFTKEELVRVGKSVAKVVKVHGRRHQELIEFQNLYLQLVDDLMPHMLKEEQELFPQIIQLADATSATPINLDQLENPIKLMNVEHEKTDEILRLMREVTKNYTTPDGLSAQAMFQEVMALEDDIHEHMHLENNILFPRAIELANVNLPVAAQ